MSRHLSPRYGQVILVSGYPVLTAVNWSQHWCTICVQYQFSCATKLARKCEIEHWFSCGADGRAGCGRCTVTWLPNFLGWVDLLTHGATQARFARQSSAINPIQNGLFYLLPANRESSEPPSLYNLKTAHPRATKITHNNVLIIFNFWAYIDWHNDVIWHHYHVILLNLLTESKFPQGRLNPRTYT